MTTGTVFPGINERDAVVTGVKNTTLLPSHESLERVSDNQLQHACLDFSETPWVPGTAQEEK